MLLLSSFAEAYHWGHKDIMELTTPQILMYSHAAWVQHERSERRYKEKDKKKKGTRQDKTHAALDNKSWKDLSPEEQAQATDDMMMQL